MNAKIIIPIAIVVIALGVFIAMGPEEEQILPVNDVSTSEPVKLSINPFPGTDYAFVAKEKGFFEKNGVNVELVLNPQYSKTIELMGDKQVDGAFEVLADAIAQNYFGLDLEIVYVTDQSTFGDVIVSKYDDVNELKGKTIGVVGINSFSHIFLTDFLQNNGIDIFDVNYENIDETNILEALNSGKIVAGHTWEPTKSEVEKAGYVTIGMAGDSPGIITDILVFHKDFAENNPQKIQGIVNAIAEARLYLDSNRDESVAIMAEIEGLSLEEMALAVNDADRPLKNEQIELFDMQNKDSVYSLGDKIVQFYINAGIFNENSDYDVNQIFNPIYVSNIELR